MATSFVSEFTSGCILRINENNRRIAQCIDLLNENELWHRPNTQLVSIGNLVVHLCGNIRQYIISSLGHLPDNRNRDEEFQITYGLSKTELLDLLNHTIAQATTIIGQTTAEELLRARSVQGFDLTGIGIVIHVTEHLSYHTGQIAWHTKMLKEKDLGFYAGIDLNTKNKTE
jgi:uncharacterized damage-inducible protein DinB